MVRSQIGRRRHKTKAPPPSGHEVSSARQHPSQKLGCKPRALYAWRTPGDRTRYIKSTPGSNDARAFSASPTASLLGDVAALTPAGTMHWSKIADEAPASEADSETGPRRSRRRTLGSFDSSQHGRVLRGAVCLTESRQRRVEPFGGSYHPPTPNNHRPNRPPSSPTCRPEKGYP